MYSIRFYKMEGIGNDYIYFDFTDIFFDTNQINEKEIPKICDRRFGIGGDGVVIITKSDKAEIKMLMWNNDGSYSKICGNALRCVSYYWYKKTKNKIFFVESGAAIHAVKILEDNFPTGIVKVNMGSPIFEKEKIPFIADEQHTNVEFYDETIFPYKGFVLSMGNPHCVFFVEDLNIPIDSLGPKIENHRLFPERTNVEFVKINSDFTLQQITWERGSGETLACGSGACAVLVASVISKNMPNKNIVHLKGGDLEIEWDRNTNEVYMTGNATFVFEGNLIKNFKLFKDL